MAVDCDRWCNGTSISSKHSQSDLEAKIERTATMESEWGEGPSSWLNFQSVYHGSEHQKQERQHGHGWKHSWGRAWGWSHHVCWRSMRPPCLLEIERSLSPGPPRLTMDPQDGFQSFSAAALIPNYTYTCSLFTVSTPPNNHFISHSARQALVVITHNSVCLRKHTLPMKMLYFAHENVCQSATHFDHETCWEWKRAVFDHWNLCLPVKMLYFAHENMLWLYCPH